MCARRTETGTGRWWDGLSRVGDWPVTAWWWVPVVVGVLFAAGVIAR